MLLLKLVQSLQAIHVVAQSVSTSFQRPHSSIFKRSLGRYVAINMIWNKTYQQPNVQFDYASCILTLLQLFRYDVSSFNGEKVHSLINVLTMGKDFHELFDRLSLYFEAVVSFWLLFLGLVGINSCYISPERRIITRSNTFANGGPLPSLCSSSFQPTTLNISLFPLLSYWLYTQRVVRLPICLAPLSI